MNLKESFRYQNFLDRMMSSACGSMTQLNHIMQTTKTHYKSLANPDASDLVEEVEVDPFYENDDVIEFVKFLIAEKDKLTTAINEAKQKIGFDLDAAIESNKFRQNAAMTVKRIMTYTPSKKADQGRDFKFNADGNQMPYYYDIEVVTTERYDRDKAKAFVKETSAYADKISSLIDEAMVNTTVDYTPRFDVNDSFEDAMEEFIAK